MPCNDPDIARLTRDMAERKRRDPSADLGALAAKRRGLQREYDKQVRLIAVARRDLALDDDTYRALVGGITEGRTTSTTATTHVERRRILAHFRAHGWRPAAKSAAAGEKKTRSSADMRAKIHAMLADQRLPESYAEAILCRQRALAPGTPCPLAMADATDLRGVIAALDRRAKRTRADRAPA